MKRIFIIAFALLLIGIGCSNVEQVEEEPSVEGDWWLVFDLPEGWVQLPDYTLDFPEKRLLPIDRTMTDIILQSTDLPIALEGEEPTDELENYVDDDYTFMRIYRYDPRTSIPEDAEDLGNDFYKHVRDDGVIRYYFIGEHGKYRFYPEQEGHTLDQAEAVILSAVEVTVDQED